MSFDRLLMPIGEAMFSQRSARKFRPDPIPPEDLRLLVEAAVKAPNGGNHQIARFLVVTDRATIREFGALYREAWWAKRWDDHRWRSPADIPPEAWERELKKLRLPEHLLRHVVTMGELHRAGRYDRLTDDVQRVTGRAAMSVREFVSLHADAFGGRRS